MACGIGAACSPCKEKDEVFHRQVFEGRGFLRLPSCPRVFDVPRFFCLISILLRDTSQKKAQG